jgi:hypothetical protein
VVSPRNKVWFQQALPAIQELWSTVVKERETGYEHRATKKRAVPLLRKLEIVISEDDNVHVIRNMPETNQLKLIKLEA